MKNTKENQGGKVVGKLQSPENVALSGPGADSKPGSKARCKATSKAGTPCRNLALPGRSYCWYHDPNLAEERRQAGRRGWKVSNRKSIEEADLLRLRTPKTVDDVVRALADVARAVMKGNLTPTQAREVTSCLNSILKAKTDEATVSELRKLTNMLEDSGQGAERLLAVLEGGE